MLSIPVVEREVLEGAPPAGNKSKIEFEAQEYRQRIFASVKVH